MRKSGLFKEQNHLPLLSGLALRFAVPLLNAVVLFRTFSTYVASDTWSAQELLLDPSVPSCWHLDVAQTPKELASDIPKKQGHQCQKCSGHLLHLPHPDSPWDRGLLRQPQGSPATVSPSLSL